MYILGIRIHASNDALVKIWAVALALILAVAAFLTWSNRFRETVETSIARISPFGAEVAGKENANFTGKRGFFSKMNQMGLPPATRKAELAALFEELEAAGAGTFADVPVLWIYAEGRTKEDRDRCVQTFGKVFFDKEKFCYSVVDGNGFSVQLDPDTFRVLWAKDGGAVCAFPLLQRTAPNAVSFFASRSAPPGARGNFAAKSRSRRCPLRNIFPREAPFPSPPKTRPTPRAKTSANPTRQKSSRRPFPSKVSRSRSAAAFSPRFRGIARRSAKSASASKETRREKFPPRRGRWTISRCARRTRRSR